MEKLIDRIQSAYESAEAKKHTKVYYRLYNAIRISIINNLLPQGEVMPATRVLAEHLSIARSTVIKSYELLAVEGYLESRIGSGYRIKPHAEALDEKRLELNAEANYAGISSLGKSFLSNISLINTTEDKSIAFRPGLPPLDIFPVTQWKNLSNLYWRHIKASALSYSPSSGISHLKQNLANYLNLSRNIKCEPEQIVIVSGSVQSLYMIGTVLLNKGDKVVMENPSFPNVHSIFKGLEAELLPIEIDAEGIKTDDFDQYKFDATKLIHVTPSNHYPTGTVMSMNRRKTLLAKASKMGAFIIENDYEHEISNSFNSLPAVFSLDTEQRTIYMGTFNRLMHPSIRLGYMVVPPYLLPAVDALQKHSHRFVPPSIQIVMNQFIEGKHLYYHVKNVLEASLERKEVFLSKFNRLFENTLEIVPSASHNLYLLAKTKNNVSDKLLVDVLNKNNIVTHSLSKCAIDNSIHQNGLIMGYASVRKPVIERKLELMSNVLNQTSLS
jgi:GntR family transcriptional regulator / MocR family aminotransferase